MTNPTLVQPTIGLRIKEKRREEGLSIRELARRTNLTASFISQVENGKANVSLDSLRRITKALGVQILYFLSEAAPQSETNKEGQPPESPEIKAASDELFDRSSPLIKRGKRARLYFPDSGVTYELLTGRLDHKMESFIGKIAPGAGNVARRLSVSTEEFILCLSGVLKVGIKEAFYMVEAGDSIYVNGNSLTSLANGSDSEDAEWLSVITPPAF
ncbi:MAG TPA: XRE family transcriptional regulator [Anaerolineaceae bacterium]|nr:XRE family transcriptional regulator [Anaerolineaceae bacterium]